MLASSCIADENGGKTFTTRTIEIEAVNDEPELKANAQLKLTSINEEGSIKISAEDILKNYTDRDKETLSIADGLLTLSDDSAGKLEGNAAKGWTFTAADNYNGTAKLNFEIQDNESKKAGTLTLDINAVNDAPTAPIGDDILTDGENAPIIISEEQKLTINRNDLLKGITDVDNEEIELEITYIYSENGIIRTNSIGEEWSFTPEKDYYGTATITYGVSDGNGGLLEHTRSLNIEAVDDTPTLVNAPDVFNDIPEDTSLTINSSDLLNFYGDADGDSLEITTLTINGTEIIQDDNGNYIFTPDQTITELQRSNTPLKVARVS